MNCPICNKHLHHNLEQRRPNQTYEYLHTYTCRCQSDDLPISLSDSFSYTAYGTLKKEQYVDGITIWLPKLSYSWHGLGHTWTITSWSNNGTYIYNRDLATGDSFMRPDDAYQLLLRYKRLLAFS